MADDRAAALAQLRTLLRDETFTPAELTDAVLHALRCVLSSGAWNTYRQHGRGALLVDLRQFADGDVVTNYVPRAMLHKLDVRDGLFADVEAAIDADDPARELLVLVWQTERLRFRNLSQTLRGSTHNWRQQRPYVAS